MHADSGEFDDYQRSWRGTPVPGEVVKQSLQRMQGIIYSLHVWLDLGLPLTSTVNVAGDNSSIQLISLFHKSRPVIWVEDNWYR